MVVLRRWRWWGRWCKGGRRRTLPPFLPCLVTLAGTVAWAALGKAPMASEVRLEFEVLEAAMAAAAVPATLAATASVTALVASEARVQSKLRLNSASYRVLELTLTWEH